MGEWTAADAVAAVERYVAGVSASDIDAIVALFTEDAELRDPYDGDTHRGHDALRAFYAAGAGAVERFSLDGAVRVTADARSAAAPLVCEADIGGAKLNIHTIDVFFFADDGRFAAMHAFYGPTNVAPRG
jgi:steroid delta-isomerase